MRTMVGKAFWSSLDLNWEETDFIVATTILTDLTLPQQLCLFQSVCRQRALLVRRHQSLRTGLRDRKEDRSGPVL
jgi:hypothetical protein